MEKEKQGIWEGEQKLLMNPQHFPVASLPVQADVAMGSLGVAGVGCYAR